MYMLPAEYILPNNYFNSSILKLETTEMFPLLSTTPYTIFTLFCKDDNVLSNYVFKKVIIDFYHNVILWV